MKIVGFVLALVLAGCAGQRIVPAGQVRFDTPENGERVKRVVAAIAVANADLCRGTIGTFTHSSGKEACAIGVAILNRPEMNALTDGTNIGITTPMMRFIQNDDELAIVIGHELGHILKEHVQETKALAIMGALVDGAIGTQGAFRHVASTAFNPTREREADRWGMFMAARADFNARAAYGFWLRMPPNDGGFLATHPATASRIEAVDRVAAEISYRRLFDLPLDPAAETPDMTKAPPAVTSSYSR